ncbi:MAG: cytochrome P450 [Candidatus Binatia bacterium]|nr:cytochrome P450 [Candidatus Binatia bacterium]
MGRSFLPSVYSAARGGTTGGEPPPVDSKPGSALVSVPMTPAQSEPARLYDPLAPDFGDHLYEIYRTLRDEHPVYHDTRRDQWALSRFADVQAALNDPATFSSEDTSISQGLLPMIQQLDSPRHDRLRALVSRAFTPRRIAEIEPRARAVAIELLDELRDTGRVDLLREFARHLPSRVIGEMIGVPADRIAMFMEFTEKMIVTPGNATSGSEEHDRSPAIAIYEEFARLLEERRASRSDDLVSALLDAELDGRGLTQEELLGFCFVLIVAGNDTTTNLIASGSVLLARHPEQRALLVAEPERIPNAIDEMLRFETPTQALPRRLTRDVELHGTRLSEGSVVSLLWGSANRDDREFEKPERFDIHREPKRHLAFGHGVHYCLGANLARLEARVAFEELLARIPDFELDGAPGWLPSIWARAHDTVPIRF